MYGHIYYRIVRPEPELLAAFSDIPTATLSDAMGRHGALASVIRPIYENIRMVGTALTVLCFPGDNLMTHKALQMVQPGDVLVIDDGDSNSGCFGHRSALAARARGGTGVVVSGSIRDVAALRQERFPVFARGVSPRAPQKNTPGSINVPCMSAVSSSRRATSSSAMTTASQLSLSRWQVRFWKRRDFATARRGNPPAKRPESCRSIRPAQP